MTQQITFTLAQLNPIVGDIHGNKEKIMRVWRDYCDHSDLIIFTELVLSGYQPEDLVLHDSFMHALKDAVTDIANETKDGKSALLISTPWLTADNKRYNAAVFIDNGEIKTILPKYHLPNYGVFDERRVFDRGDLPSPVDFKGIKLGILTCEDTWKDDVSAHLKHQGADILISINGSPFEIKKDALRRDVIGARVKETGLPVIYTNQVGGQDEVVYDGGSFVMGNDGDILVQMPFCREDVSQIEFPFNSDRKSVISSLPSPEEAVYSVLKLGLQDYVDKNGFPGILLGLSGGIDSALSAVIAVDALGAERVHCVMLPSPYTSQISLDDAAELAENLGCRYDVISIEPAMQAFDAMLGNDIVKDLTAENIQSRARGMTLMALSNSNGKMVLSTGNKSEMAVGYATLYGDMCGGYNALKDIYKTQVFDLSKWRNAQGYVMPERIITRPPSAELRHDQADTDSLPPYEILDKILMGLIEKRQSVSHLVTEGYNRDTVQHIRHLLDRSEYKRRQSAPGVKITPTAFGRERRMPITNKYENA